MEDYSVSASIDMVQALKRFLYLQRYSIHLPSSPPSLHLPNAVAERFSSLRLDYPTADASGVPGEKSGSTKLLKMAAKGHDVLIRANTVFPFTLFPDTVIIDREKLTIVKRLFFATAKIISVPIADILSVEVDVGPFFGSIHISSRYFIRNPYSVNYLGRNYAIKLQRLLQGYIIAHERKVDCSGMGKEELKILLEDLGKVTAG